VKISIDGLHKAFENRVRLGIMSVLAVNDMLDFNSLKDFFDITDGKRRVHKRKKIIYRQKAQYQVLHVEKG
jgi:hypothetical protein